MAYAVSAMGQSIVQDPAETVSRGYHLLRFLRKTVNTGLIYGKAPDGYGQWGQLKWKQTSGSIDVFSDAMFLVDSELRSTGSAQLFWGGWLHCHVALW